MGSPEVARLLRARFAVCLALALAPGLGWVSAASAQFTLSSSSTQTGASAVTPACSDLGNGGVGVPIATASCALPVGYTASASASASFSADAAGGVLSVTVQVDAATPGTTPVEVGNSNAFATSFASWSISAPVLYSVAITGTTAPSVQGNGGVSLPPSGSLAAGESLTVSMNPNRSAVARDSGPITATGSEGGEASVTLVPVGASDLISGTVLAGGNGMAGLLVEALVSGSPVASTTTASDGSYLLSGLPGLVVLRLSDPGGRFVTELSPSLWPPTTYDADLAPVPSAPGLGGAGWAILTLLMSGLGAAYAAERRASRAR